MSEGQPTFYRIDSSGFTFKEYLWGTKNPLTLLIAGIIKLLRINMGGSIDDPAVDVVYPFEIAESQIPPDIFEQFYPVALELLGLDFEAPIFHAVEDKLNFTTIYWATYRHRSGAGFARIHCRIWTKTHPRKFYLFPVFVTIFQDGTALFSSAGKPDSELPREITTLRLQGKPTAELWNIHQTEVHKIGKQVRPMVDEQTLRDTVETYHRMARDFHLRRRAFRQLRKVDEQHAAIIEQARAEAAARGLANPETIAELQLLEKAPPNRANSIWILIVTAGAFLLAGGAQDSFANALLLIPILLFHEMGHYLAMYIFKYRNLQMFFIPFLGAAVTGQKYNVAGWKRVVVFLMGPLPGIVLGAALAGAGIARENKLAVEAAMLCIFINGFNLLPLLPFDGGRVVGTILFSRNYILDTVFRVLTAIGIILLAFALNAQFLMAVGVVSLIAVAPSFKVAKVTESVREMKLPTVTPDGEGIPTQTADIVITELKKKFPKGLNKQIAQHTLTVFETLNARPPGWLASIFFLGVHGFAFLASLIGVGVIAFYQRGDLGGAAFAFGRPPRTAVSSALMKIDSKEQARGFAPGNTVAIVGTYKKRPAAEQAYAGLIAELPSNGEGVLFGNTVYLRVPATNNSARTLLFEQLNKGTTNIFVERTNYGATIAFQFDVPKEKQTAEWFKTFNEYWEFTGQYQLIPPWCPEGVAGTQVTSEQLRARHTLHLLDRADDEPKPKRKATDTAEFDGNEIAQAVRIGDTEKVERIQKRIRERAENERKQRIDRVRSLSDTEVHRAVLESYMDYPSDTNKLAAYKAAQEKLRGLVGSVTEPGSEPWRYSSEGGWLIKSGDSVSIHGVEFNDFPRGAPALITWLEKHGVEKIRYRLEGTYRNPRGGSSDEEE
jgi:Zn-dependent protease